MGKARNKKFTVPKTITDKLLVNASNEDIRVLSDSYKFDRRLAQGTCPLTLDNTVIVYIATDTRSGDKCVIKLIAKSLTPKDKLAELAAETAVLKDLNHPSIVGVREVASDDQYNYVITE